MFRHSRLKLFLIACLSFAVCLTLFHRDLGLLFSSDPVKARTVELSFHDLRALSSPQIASCEGFINQGQRLQLPPGKSGKLILSFSKESSQGVLLRVWFYGDRGEQRPNAIKISTDAGHTFTTVASNGNFIGSVFDLTPFVAQGSRFQLMFTADNRSPFTPAVLDKVEVITGATAEVRPALPDLPRILAVFYLVFFICYAFLPNRAPARQWIAPILCAGIVLLAACLRWEELVRVSGTLLDPDARGYRELAEKMKFFSANGFYSARFGMREPFFISAVKLFFMFTCPSDTHLRMVSSVFSVVVVYLTYRVGREWFNEATGLIAACILAVHPYLIALSARGLREELFTTLLLLFIYCGHIKPDLSPRARAVTCGVLAGCLLLTRFECLPLLFLTLACYLILLRRQWNVRMAAAVLAVAIVLVLPHLYNTYTRYGDPFYAVNHHTRFYANIEFAGQPGFPTAEQIAQEGWYAGPRITPFEYYFKYHSLWQVAARSTMGFGRTTFAMPGSFAEGKGNLERVTHSLEELKSDFNSRRLLETLKLFYTLIAKDIADYLMATMLLLSFLSGIILFIWKRWWILFVYLIVFQIQTAFIASVGIEDRLAVHAYPMIALCCAYALSAGCQYAMRFLRGKEKAARILQKEEM
jgi:4-amino-4-deoxy-L-arabinose transferase-like glycosyltransferase